LNGGVGRRAKGAEDQEDLVALDQLACLLDGFRWTVGVVIRNEVDPAAINTPFRVYLAKIGRLGPADDAVGRRWPAVRHNVADFDLSVSGAGVVFLLGGRGASAGSKHYYGGRKRRQSSGDEGHSVSPCQWINECVCSWGRTLSG